MPSARSRFASVGPTPGRVVTLMASSSSGAVQPRGLGHSCWTTPAKPACIRVKVATGTEHRTRSGQTSCMTLLADVVRASQEVAETSSRSRKVAVLAELLARLDPGEVPIVTGVLSGTPRQGRIGVGYSTVYGAQAGPSLVPSLTVDELDAAIAELQ